MAVRISLRVAGPMDEPAVSSLLEASYIKLLARDYEPDLLAKLLPLVTKANSQLLTSEKFYVAQTELGEFIGCGGWSREQPGTDEIRQGEAHIRHFATHPNWIRRGVGRALLNRCIQDARNAAIKILECHSSLSAVDFYRASGFLVIRPIVMQSSPDVSTPGILLRRGLA
jgi:N-acetylglutamate synthase-like GNAT family acetyltransferase